MMEQIEHKVHLNDEGLEPLRTECHFVEGHTKSCRIKEEMSRRECPIGPVIIPPMCTRNWKSNGCIFVEISRFSLFDEMVVKEHPGDICVFEILFNPHVRTCPIIVLNSR